MQNLNFELNQSVIDNLEAVTYTSVATAGNTSVSVTDAAFYPTTLREGSPSDGVYVKYSAKCVIRNSWIGSLAPKPADTITRTDGSVWTVLSAMKPVISGVWQIDCIDLILSNGLSQLGILIRPSNTQKDSAGRLALTTYTTIAASIPCRVQPVTGSAEHVGKRRTMVRRFTAFLGTQIVPQARDIFSVANIGYTVLGFSLPQRIDELMTLDLELIDGSDQSSTGSSGGGSSGIPGLLATPQASGIPLVGNTLTTTSGTWTGSPTFAYLWSSGGVAVSGATSASYVCQLTDVGNLMVCVVTATGTSGVGSASSNPIGPVVTGEGLTGTFSSGTHP